MDRTTWIIRTPIYFSCSSSERWEKLEDLYVDPDYRAGGIGKAFFAELGKIAQEKVRIFCLCEHSQLTLSRHKIKNCGRLDWNVRKVRDCRIAVYQSYICVVFQWNKPAIGFYETNLGAKMRSEWVGMRLEEDGIDNLKTLVRDGHRGQ